MNSIGAPLNQTDFKHLEQCGISPGTAEQGLLTRVDSLTAAEIVGRNGAGKYEGILFPYIWPGDQHVREYRLRRDEPEIENGKAKNKYLSPPGRGNMLYFVPGTDPEWLEDLSLPILITEGRRNALPYGNWVGTR